MVLNELCQTHEIPYWDLASDIDTTDARRFGGRILYSTDGEMCLFCQGLLEQDDIRQALAPETERWEEALIYGIPVEALGTSGPSVVALNGIIASVAIMEFLVELVGIRPAFRHLVYDGSFGRLVLSQDLPDEDCYFCKGIRGLGAEFDLKRHL